MYHAYVAMHLHERRWLLSFHLYKKDYSIDHHPSLHASYHHDDTSKLDEVAARLVWTPSYLPIVVLEAKAISHGEIINVGKGFRDVLRNTTMAPLRCVDISNDNIIDPNIAQHNTLRMEKHLENFNFSKNYFWSAGSADFDRICRKSRSRWKHAPERVFVDRPFWGVWVDLGDIPDNAKTGPKMAPFWHFRIPPIDHFLIPVM